MKKILSIVLMLSIIFGITSCGTKNTEGTPGNAGNTETSSGNGAKVYEMKISHITTMEDPLHIGYLHLKEILEERTNGQIQVKIFPNKQLANSDREQAEMVQQNLAQLGTSPTFTVAALNPDLKEFFIYDYPYLMRDSNELYRFADSEIFGDMCDELESLTGIKGYPGFHIGWVKISSNSKPISDPDALKDLKIRTTSSDMYIELVKSFGANPTIVNYGELYTALQQGTVEGMMTTTVLYVSDRFYEVQKFMGAINPFTIFHMPLINKGWYDSLPSELQKTLDECMTEYIAFMRELEDEKEVASIQALRDQGMEVYEYSEDEMQVFRELGAQVVERQKDVAGAEFVDRVIEFLKTE